MKIPNLKYLVAGVLIASVLSCKDQNPGNSESIPSLDRNLVVDLADTGIKIQPTMYGIFFEDINFAADGGLYAEMIKS